MPHASLGIGVNYWSTPSQSSVVIQGWGRYQQNQPQAAPGFYFTLRPQASLGPSVKTKNPTGNPIGLILVWELLDSITNAL